MDFYSSCPDNMSEEDEGSELTDDLSDYSREERLSKRRRIEQRSQGADRVPEEEQEVEPSLDDLVRMEVGPPPSPRAANLNDHEAWPVHGNRWSAEESLENLEALHGQWFPADLQPDDRAVHPLRVLGFNASVAAGHQHTAHEIECKKRLMVSKARCNSVLLEMRRHELLLNDDAGLLNQQRLRQVLGALYFASEILQNTFQYVAEYIPEFDSRTESSLAVRQFTTMMDEVQDDSKEYQQLMLFLYREAYHRGYRKCGQMCYERVYTPDGIHFTYAWQEAMSINQFVREATGKTSNFRQWCNRMAHKDNTMAVIREMTEGIDDEFPEVDMDRDVFAFENGIYIGRNDVFHRYDQGVATIQNTAGICKEPVAAMYFPVVLPDQYQNLACSNWEQIPTPNVDKILKFQGFDQHENVMFWFYVFLGRWLFNIKDFDDWQVAPFFLGMAGTGKSTLMNMFKRAYPPNKVGTLSNNIEKKFGLGSLAPCFSWIAPEVKYDFCLSQAELQSIVSGESVSVAVKFKGACNMIWKSPGLFSGNQIPKFSDNSGSVSRRLPVFRFDRLVTQVDGGLDRKLEAEHPYFIVKSIKAYRYALQLYGTQGVWENLPAYFHNTRGELQEATNALVHFIRSDKMERGRGLYVPIKDFKEAFDRHCDDNHFHKGRWVKDYYHGPFQMNSLNVQELRRQYPRNRPVAPTIHCHFVIGCDLKAIQVDDPFMG